MQVLLIAGDDGTAIVDSIESKLNSAGISLYSEKSTDDMDELYSSGNWYDKIIVLELGITNNGIDTDEMTIRNRVSRFVNIENEIGTLGRSYIFVAFDRKNASIIDEELMGLGDRSVVLVLEDKLKSTFLISLVRDDIVKIREMYSDKVYVDVQKNMNVKKVNEPIQQTVPNYTLNYGDPIGDLFDDETDESVDDLSGLDYDNSWEMNQLHSNNTFNNEVDIDDKEDVNQDEQYQNSEFNGYGIDHTGNNYNNYSMEDENNYTQNEGMDASGIGNDYSGNEYTGFTDSNNMASDYSNYESTGNEYNQNGYNEYEDANNAYNQNEQYTEQEAVDANDYMNDPAMWGNDMYEDNTNQNSMYTGYNPELDSYNQAGNQSSGTDIGFDDSYYNEEPEVSAPVKQKPKKMQQTANANQTRRILNAFANRGNSILITGCGGCGVSTIALNLANTINNLGYTVLLVDLDTENKSQSYISRENYDCVDPDSGGLRAAINSTSGINAHVSIVREGFHLLTMGMASDSIKFERAVQKDKISRFINMAKTNHNFVIYDCPFETAIGYGSEFTSMADNLVITIDCSNWGIAKTMLKMCNIDSDDLEDTIFSRGQLLFNRYKALNRVLGRKVKTVADIARAMDYKVRDLIGEDPDYYFQAMNICGAINFDPAFEMGWFNTTQYSDTKEGGKIFIELLTNIVLAQ